MGYYLITRYTHLRDFSNLPWARPSGNLRQHLDFNTLTLIGYAIWLTDKFVVQSFSFAVSINLLSIHGNNEAPDASVLAISGPERSQFNTGQVIGTTIALSLFPDFYLRMLKALVIWASTVLIEILRYSDIS